VTGGFVGGFDAMAKPFVSRGPVEQVTPGLPMLIRDKLISDWPMSNYQELPMAQFRTPKRATFDVGVRLGTPSTAERSYLYDEIERNLEHTR
jgi:hypothetical protein